MLTHRVGRPGRQGPPVPEHVKHPHKYTCYPLDTPLVIGSGVLPEDDRHRMHAEGNAPSEDGSVPGAGVHNEEARFKAVAGSGVIAFQKPRKQSSAAHAVVQKPRQTSVTMALDVDDHAQGGDTQDVASAHNQVPVSFRKAAAATKQRQLRHCSK